MKLFFEFFFIFYFFSSSFIFSADGISKSIEVRILIEKGVSKVNIKTFGSVYVYEEKTKEKYILLENSNYEIIPQGDNFLLITDEKVLSPIYIESNNPSSYLIINDKKYRGKFKFLNKNGYINVIEYVDLERYLWGVLGPEMGVSWPIEALKAQAVAARTYTLKSIDKNAEYDMTNTTSHQVYTGFENISPQIISAVNETRGEVLSYKDDIFYAYYHANSGGHTTTPSGAWNSNVILPLKGVSDPYYKYSRNAKWYIYITNLDILRFINKNGYGATKVKDIKIYSKDRSGRAIKLLFKTDRGNIKLEAKDFRNFIGTYDLKSTFITKIEKLASGYKFYGKGWGHGVGLCQDGARFMADKGYNYKKILSFYYPGSKIIDFEKLGYGN
ncbi:MAG: SpoIID/LytB domain-containing protein [Elusimicrobiota bacterium]